MLYIIYLCVNIHIYLFIHLSRFFFYYCALCMYLLWNDFMCISLYMIMCMLLSATSTHFKWELMLYCLHCPTLLNKVFLHLLLLMSDFNDSIDTDLIQKTLTSSKFPEMYPDIWIYCGFTSCNFDLWWKQNGGLDNDLRKIHTFKVIIYAQTASIWKFYHAVL